MRRFWAHALALSLHVAVLSATPAHAADPAERESDARTPTATPGGDMDSIREEPVQELKEQKREKEALEEDLLEQEAAKEPETTYPLIGRDRWSYDWRNGSYLTRKDGLFELHFGAQGQLDAGGFHLDAGLDAPTRDGWRSKIDFRRCGSTRRPAASSCPSP